MVGDKVYARSVNDELVYFIGNDWQLILSPELNNIKAIYPGRSTMLWVFTEKNILLISKGFIIAKFPSGNQLNGMDISDVTQDEMSSLWIASSK